MKKKLICLMLSVCSIFAFSACGEEPTQQIDYSSIKIESVEDFSLEAVAAQKAEKRFICELDTGKYEGTVADYDLYYYGLSEVTITVGDTTVVLVDALDNGVLSAQLLLDKFEADKDAGKCKSDMYQDGGTLYYEYSDFKVLKFNVDGGINDLYIGIPDMPYEVKDK